MTIQKKIFGLFNIGSDKSVSLKELISIIKKVTNSHKLDVKIEGENMRSFYLDNSLFKKKSKITFEQNLFSEIKKIFLLIIQK